MEYRDTFVDNRGNWLIQNIREIGLQIKSGYVIEHRQDAGFWVVWRNFGLQPNSVFSIRATIQRIMSAPKSYFGITWSQSDQNRFFYHMFSPSRHFATGKFVDDTWNPFVNWTLAPIAHEISASNSLAIHMGKQHLQASVNGQEVLRIARPTEHYGTSVGFIIGPAGKIRITELAVVTEDNLSPNYEYQDEYTNYKEEDLTFRNSRGYMVNTDAHVLINGRWVDPAEAEEYYRQDDLLDGYVDDD